MSDVCLVLEGTYPYVRGGVSSWVHDMIKGMPDIKFSLISIMPSPHDTRKEQYEVPSNVQSIVNIYLHEYFINNFYLRKYPRLFDFFNFFFEGVQDKSNSELESFLAEMIKNRHKINLAYAFYSRDYWKCVRNMYEKGDNTVTFLDFFWNFRFTFLPLIQLIKAEIPPAPLYHTISTGYAGMMAALAKIKFNSNMVTTEHGIYTKERRIEIAQSSWLYEKQEDYIKATPEFGYFKTWWSRYFEVMSQITYKFSDKITTLYQGNIDHQIKDGADPKKTSIIANGINLERFSQTQNQHTKKEKRNTIAFVGRVVPIKDVKTFIKACKIVVNQMPEAKILVIGPQDEESQYYQECSLLIKTLGLEKHVVFTGHVNMQEYYKKIDLIVLTSISEAQPLVILEASACGVPSVSSDVGSCRELLEGKNHEDKKLGPSGIICQFHSPEQTADGILKLLKNDKLYNDMSLAGIKRVNKYYNLSDMITNYRRVYEEYI